MNIEECTDSVAKAHLFAGLTATTLGSSPDQQFKGVGEVDTCNVLRQSVRMPAGSFGLLLHSQTKTLDSKSEGSVANHWQLAHLHVSKTCSSASEAGHDWANLKGRSSSVFRGANNEPGQNATDLLSRCPLARLVYPFDLSFTPLEMGRCVLTRLLRKLGCHELHELLQLRTELLKAMTLATRRRVINQ
ncbi:unnamed protein product [Protopolystoma xenopodis]|uniref:Uncharacterized protein n=1 Tax=Protopolystoma xenopodis TaxID=117903 RepID=A0A448WIU0_9PLAT|nr:unnamed protein product [Protopolystoma xenopodis]